MDVRVDMREVPAAGDRLAHAMERIAALSGLVQALETRVRALEARERSRPEDIVLRGGGPF
jgi:hypothetical protein